MIISNPFKFHPYWREVIWHHLESLNKENDGPRLTTNELMDSLEHRMADCHFITDLREPTIDRQRKATAKLIKALKSLSKAINEPHNLELRFEAKNIAIRGLLRNLDSDISNLHMLLDAPNCPAPRQNHADPIRRIRKPHIRQIALIVCDWISSLEHLQIPLSDRYDVISNDSWCEGQMSFASRLVELCIWDHETQQKCEKNQIRFIRTLEETGQPRANLKTVMADAVKLIKSKPIKD